ncbi:MAG: exosome complex RNA-binding protein Rrp4 [Candidatus Korarchaeota archaeon]|nr:exosome complex RNA-binding protein Rrp4 [Candidatus Korarchaeota archaeon]
MSESAILVKNREVVVPGQPLAKGRFKLGRDVYRDESGIIRAKKLGLADIKEDTVSVVPLSGVYIPKEGDIVIGIISRISGSTIIVDIRSPYQGVIPIPRGRATERVDMRKYDLKLGDVILAKVKAFDGSSSLLLTIDMEGLGKLEGGYILEVEPAKVPRLIGKRQSMVTLLKEKTVSDIIVGNNGRIWVRSPSLKELLALEKALRKIEAESHVSGLSDRISSFLTQELSD